jgi:hypothetical protein
MAIGNRDLESLPAGSSVEARARFHFRSITRALGVLESALLDVEAEMEILAREFRAALAPTSLVLFIKRRPDRRPCSLHWGRGFKFAMPDGTIRSLRKHLTGRLTGGRIYHIGRRYGDKELYFDFDRRRLKLNRRHAKLAHALDLSRRSLKRLAGRAGGPPDSPFPSIATSDWDGIVWRVSTNLAEVQEAMLRLVADIRAHPIFPYARIRASGSISMGWAVEQTIMRDGRLRKGRRHLALRLTNSFMRTLALPRREWASLQVLDRRMRSLCSMQTVYIRSFAQVRMRSTAKSGSHEQVDSENR